MWPTWEQGAVTSVPSRKTALMKCGMCHYSPPHIQIRKDISKFSPPQISIPASSRIPNSLASNVLPESILLTCAEFFEVDFTHGEKSSSHGWRSNRFEFVLSPFSFMFRDAVPIELQIPIETSHTQRSHSTVVVLESCVIDDVDDRCDDGGAIEEDRLK